jgi:hypothetical protein
MFQKTGLVFLGIGLLLLIIGLFSGWTDSIIIFCLLTPLIFIWTGVILLIIKPKDMSAKPESMYRQKFGTPLYPPVKKIKGKKL